MKLPVLLFIIGSYFVMPVALAITPLVMPIALAITPLVMPVALAITPLVKNNNIKKISKTKKVAKKLYTNNCTIELKITGAIGAATLDIIETAIKKVTKKNCSSLLLLINTPGGQLLSTRKIVNRILTTDFPVLCLISPAGAHAGSAGAIIMQACHINGGLETTNIGAATPIAGGGQKISNDLRKKMINDITSWLDSLTQLRKRNKTFGQKIVTEAKALSAYEAHKIKAIDFVGKTKQEFLHFANNKKVSVKDGVIKTVTTGTLIPLNLGLRHHVISFITNPENIYILFTGSLFLLYYEITHPGLGAPGILGTIGLVFAFIGMHRLNFEWAGLILLLLSMVLFLAEIFISGFGIFGISAIVSFVLGSLLIFDPAKTGGVDIPLSLIASVTFVFTLFMSAVTWLAWSTLKIKTKNKFIDNKNATATVVNIHKNNVSGLVFINGEHWKFYSTSPVKIGDTVKIIYSKDLLLKVEPVFNSKS